MLSEPTIVQRDEQPYAAISASVTMAGFDDVIPRAHGEVAARLDALGVEPVGAPFVRYNVIQQWARANGLSFAASAGPSGDRFESRLEVYLTDPAEEPDPSNWQTEVAYLLAHD
jgi:hypothetical protein